MRMQSQWDLAGTPITLSGTLGWQHSLGRYAPMTGMRFADGGTFKIVGLQGDRNRLIGGINLSARLSKDASLAVAYTGQISTNSNTHSIHAALNIRF